MTTKKDSERWHCGASQFRNCASPFLASAKRQPEPEPASQKRWMLVNVVFKPKHAVKGTKTQFSL